MKILELENVAYTRDDIEILKGITIDIEKRWLYIYCW